MLIGSLTNFFSSNLYVNTFLLAVILLNFTGTFCIKHKFSHTFVLHFTKQLFTDIEIVYLIALKSVS